MSNKNIAPTNSWLVSFGDLLTLLLCFFLAIVAMSPLNSNNKKNTKEITARNDSAKTALRDAKQDFQGSGTGFADKYVAPESLVSASKKLSFALKLSDFSDDGLSLTEIARERAKTFVNSIDYKKAGLEISSCANTVAEVGESELWRLTSDRTLALKRQLFDSGGIVGKDTSYRLKMLAGNCDFLRAQISESSDEVVASIRFLE